ncbi:MAG: hypothetical protein FD155_2650 [Bacteroidetes bacterium]|nr:MAG: hypothetical protein FD155_2650 [Bacteroidota bacterium]
MKDSVSIAFFLRGTRQNVKGESPVYVRVSVNGQRVNSSTGIFVDPTKWVPGRAAVKGNSEYARTINTSLDNMRTAILKFINNLEANGSPVTISAISEYFNPKISNHRTLLETFDYHNNKIKGLIGKEYSKATYNKFVYCRNKTAEFIQHEYGKKDMALADLNHAFVTNLDYFLRTVHNIGNNTTVKYMQSLHKIIRLAIQNEWLQRDPFVNFKVSLKETSRTYLTETELSLLQNKIIDIPRLAQIRDVFLFSCYTGLAYIDIYKLTPSDITIGIDGEKWIITHRTKTETRSPIPLLPQALEIIERYKTDLTLIARNKLLPVITNQKTNAFLKEIAIICGIAKNLTFHMARHTFATTVTLTNGVPIETVSKMLGHTSIRTTQIYGKVVDTKISHDMKQLREKLNPTTQGRVVNFDA